MMLLFFFASVDAFCTMVPAQTLFLLFLSSPRNWFLVSALSRSASLIAGLP